jgi:hypothetical protein
MAECVFVSFFRALFGSACLALTVTGCGGVGAPAALALLSPCQTKRRRCRLRSPHPR